MKKERDKKDCKFYIDCEEEDNCCLISIEKNGPMTIDQIAKRLNLSYARVSQIEKIALKKLKQGVGQ